MFSLFHEVPNVRQGWRVMLRGLHLPKLLVDSDTITFLESVKGGVEWKPLPPDNNSGSTGIIFDANAIELEGNIASLFSRLNLTKPPESVVCGLETRAAEAEAAAAGGGAKKEAEDTEEEAAKETAQEEKKERGAL